MTTKSRQPIPLTLKKACVEACENGKTSREVYNEIYLKQHKGMTYESFRRTLKFWKKAARADMKTLAAGTYEGFTAHDATVQVNNKGEVVQAWIKQAVDDGQWEKLLETIAEHREPVIIEASKVEPECRMLEIPLYDLHLPLSDHNSSVCEVLRIVERRRWEEINIVIGQDMFHNDDFRGRTASGRVIEQVDISEAWELARKIYFSIIEASIRNAEKVNVIYSYGNHDESLSWAFVQLLKDRYPQISVDDRMEQRKCISWRQCFVGITHGAYAKSGPQDLRGQFTIEFPVEFASATVREIHAGHLHHEKEADVYGVMTRRLSRSGTTDKWSKNEGYVGAHKRFMVFEWAPGELKTIHYV